MTPSLTISAYAPLSPYVTLDSGVTLGYRYYLDGNGRDELIVDFGSGGGFGA